MKNRAVASAFIILLIFLASTSFFWYQVFRIKELPVSGPAPDSTTKEVGDFIKLVYEVVTPESEPMPGLSGMVDPFVKKVAGAIAGEQQPEVAGAIAEVKLSEIFVLSSISYSRFNALAVVNGAVLAEGDIIPGSKFMIENIDVNKVEISDSEKKYTLKVETR